MSGIEEGAAVGGAGGAGAGAGTAATTAGTAGAAGAAGGGTLSTILQSLGIGGGGSAAPFGAIESSGGGATGIAGQSLATPAGLQGGVGALPGGMVTPTPGLLSQAGTGLSNLGQGALQYAKTNPLKTATGTFDAYKQLREELKPGPLAPLPARQPQQPLVGPNLVGQGGGAGIMSPAQRLSIIMQQMQGAPGQ